MYNNVKNIYWLWFQTFLFSCVLSVLCLIFLATPCKLAIACWSCLVALAPVRKLLSSRDAVLASLGLCVHVSLITVELILFQILSILFPTSTMNCI